MLLRACVLGQVDLQCWLGIGWGMLKDPLDCLVPYKSDVCVFFKILFYLVRFHIYAVIIQAVCFRSYNKFPSSD